MSIIHEFPALGTTWWIELFDELSESQRAVIYDDCALFVANFEATYSRFKNNSFVSILNRERTVTDVDPSTITLLRYTKQLYLATAGHFNVLVGDTLEARGYDSTYSFRDSGEASEIGNPITDLIIDDTSVSLLKGKLDIGGFGKGYLIDLVASRLREQYECQYFLINGGGDIYVTSDHDKAITIHLEHPLLPNTSIGAISLKNEGFAASSPFKRRWKTATGETDHIVGQHDEVATYVRATTTAEADAFATTALLMSESACLALAKDNHLQIARFNPATNQLWQTSGFST